MDSVAVRFILVYDEISYNTVNNARVDYTPSKKYRIEKRNAFDPAYLHRRGAYCEDTITVTAILTPAGYEALKNMFAAPGKLYVEFAVQGSLLRQYPVIVTGFPQLTDDLREYPDETKITLLSRYSGNLEVIDWDTYSIPDGMENYE